MQVTLNQIKKNYPCTPGWNTLLASLNKTHADDDPLELMDILKSNGLDDALWCLRCLTYKEYCLFLADVAESVLPYFDKHNSSRATRQAIDAIRQYKRGEISQTNLEKFYVAATKELVIADYAPARVAAAALRVTPPPLSTSIMAAAFIIAVSVKDTAADSANFTQTITRLFIKHFEKDTSCN